MKLITLLCLLIVITSCRKQEFTPKQTKPVFCFVRGDMNQQSPKEYHRLVGVPCILLDFDGYDLPAGSGWNNGNPKTIAPSGLHQDSILKILRKMRDDYAPINVIIDTAMQSYNDAPADRRTIVVFTTDTTISPVPAAAIASQNAFVLGGSNPLAFTPGAFVFPPIAGQNTNALTFAASHEVGHTMNQHHSVYCDPGGGMAPIGPFGYFQNSSVSYMPIMNMYYLPTCISTWMITHDDHSCPQGTGIVDQLQNIANLCGWVTDEAGPDFATAKEFTMSHLFNVGPVGVMSQGEVDVWKYKKEGRLLPATIYVKVQSIYATTTLFNFPGGAESFYANIDILVETYNASGVLQAIYDPWENPNTSNIMLQDGWYLKIRGTDDNPYIDPINMTGQYQIVR
jgi:hypothetical protein